MGGFGSGDYERNGAKMTVEACLPLAVGDLRGHLSLASAGTLVWRSGDAVTDLAVFDVIEGELGLCLALHYRLPDAEGNGIEGIRPCPPESYHQFTETREVHFPIRLQETRPGFGGKRWWFTCPLTVNGRACNRRVRKLYLPPGARYFGCLHCYNLSYRTSQEAHRVEKRIERLASIIRRLTETVTELGMSSDT